MSTPISTGPAGSRSAPTLAPPEADAALREPPGEPVDPGAFSSNTLFGQPGIYPQGPEMVPASGPPLDVEASREVLRRSVGPGHVARALDRFESSELCERVPDPQVRAALVLLGDGPAAPVLDAFLDDATPVLRLGVGRTVGEGRVIGTEIDDPDPARRVLDERYAAEHPGVIAPSLAHAICHHDEMASNAEEATLHGVLAATHTWLLAGDPQLGGLRTELARRQASLTISLLNARSPGSSAASIRCPDGPGTIPGGNPALQGPDLWGIPFTSRPAEDCDLFVPHPVRESLARLAASTAPQVPDRYGEHLGEWLSAHMGQGAWFGPVVRLTAGRALGLLPNADPGA